MLFFGSARDATGVGEEQIDVENGPALGDLRRQYETRFPRLGEMSSTLLIAVNEEFRDRSWRLREGDEVAFIPPVSGGQDGSGSDDVLRLTRTPILTAQLAEDLKKPADGAVVVFEGIVRDHLGDRRTRYLEYEAYESMALKKMLEIAVEARAKFRIDRIGIIHRLGRIEIRETSVAIIVTAEHRAAAFDACRYLIDRLKQVVPIWKKEFFEDGFIWAEGEQQATAAR